MSDATGTPGETFWCSACDVTFGGPANGAGCSFPFADGVDRFVGGCSDRDDVPNSFWCRDGPSSAANWGYCTHACLNKSLPGSIALAPEQVVSAFDLRWAVARFLSPPTCLPRPPPPPTPPPPTPPTPPTPPPPPIPSSRSRS